MKVENLPMSSLPSLTRPLKIFLDFLSAKSICTCIHFGILDICGLKLYSEESFVSHGKALGTVTECNYCSGFHPSIFFVLCTCCAAGWHTEMKAGTVPDFILWSL